MAKKGAALKKANRCCCFCGATSTSKEHIWPEWSHPLLPDGPTHIRSKLVNNRDVRSPWSRQGSPSKIQIRAVCRQCNSGWMNQLETTTRPLLEKLIRCDRLVLSEDDFANISKYFTMKFMVADHSPMATPTFNESERKSFFETRDIPANLKIVLFNYRVDPDMVAQYNKETFNVPLQDGTKVQADGFANYTVRFGHLMVQGLFVRNGAGELKGDGFAIVAHPFTHAPVSWPPLFSLTQALAYSVQHSMEASARNSRSGTRAVR